MKQPSAQLVEDVAHHMKEGSLPVRPVSMHLLFLPLHLYIMSRTFSLLGRSFAVVSFGCTLSSWCPDEVGTHTFRSPGSYRFPPPNTPSSAAAVDLPHPFASSGSSCTHMPSTPSSIFIIAHSHPTASYSHHHFGPFLLHLMVSSHSAVFLLRIA